MGKIDARTHAYMSDNIRFADVVNYLVYDGEQRIKPEQLHEMDPMEIAFPFGEDKGSDVIQKYRDLLKYANVKEADDRAYMIIGIENQDEVHYAMPVRNMLYDAAQYSKQVSNIAKGHRKDKSDKTITSGEFLGGFYKKDKLIPVITIVIYWSDKEWDGPLSLHDMIEGIDEIKRFIPNYRLNIISPAKMSDGDFGKLHSTLAKVLKYIKYYDDMNALKLAVNNDNVYSNIDRETAELINDISGRDLLYDEGKESVNMCRAHDDMKKEAARDRAVEIAKAFIELGQNSLEDIAKATKLPIKEVQALAKTQ